MRNEFFMKAQLCTAFLACALAIPFAGCGDGNKKTTNSANGNSNLPPATADDPSDRSMNPEAQEPPQKSDESYSTQRRRDTEPVNQDPGPPPEPATPPAQPAQPAGEDDAAAQEAKRQEVMNQIYAQIRIQMDQAITERKQLLDNGTPASDEKVRQLESKIMKAREFLIGNGEEVEDVDPPIVQAQP